MVRVHVSGIVNQSVQTLQGKGGINDALTIFSLGNIALYSKTGWPQDAAKVDLVPTAPANLRAP